MKLDLKGLNEAEKAEAKILAGEILVEQINLHLDKSESPVSGGSYKRKLADGKSNSRLFEDGDMRSQITFEELDSDHIMVGIFENAPEVERLKSYNHNVGDTLPRRQFIPAPNRKFKESIMKKVNNAIQPIKEESKERARRDEEVLELVFSIDDISTATTATVTRDTAFEDFLSTILTGDELSEILGG